MKNLLFLLTLGFAFPAYAQDDAIARHFNQYLNDDAFTAVYVSPKMFEAMASRQSAEMDEDLRKMIRSMRAMRVVQKNGADGSALYKSAGEKLLAQRYEELMTLREKGEQIRFFTQGGSGQKVKEVVMVVSGAKRFLLLSMVGDIDLNTIAKLAKSLNVQGADLLEKVKK
ncbi:MAG: DUF4252 domain-containing protein [Saprospiraceae bacterium]|jgi:hypothetical protein|nr:DUF4252 domain-containing protein [Saprospiraceae bacterium]